MNAQDLPRTYRMIADLLLHPNERYTNRAQTEHAVGAWAPGEAQDCMRGFIEDPMSWSSDEYVRVLELAPICPLYLGTYLFDEPTTCRGVGTSGRNAYMLEVSGVYRHFGFQLCGGELPDYMPAMIEFCGVSLEQRARDGIGLRHRFLERFVLPALKPLEESLDKCGSSYAQLVRVIRFAVQDDLDTVELGPSWKPPVASRQDHGVRLAVLSSPSDDIEVAAVTSSREEGR